MNFNDFIKKSLNNKLYIYGAGVYGYYVLKYIYESFETPKIDAILVSTKVGNYNNIFGVPVKTFKEIKDIDDSYIIIAAGTNIAKSMYENLALQNCCKEKIYIINEDEYRYIRCKNPDVISEVRQEIKALQRNINCITNKSMYKSVIQDEARYKSDFIEYISDSNMLKNKISSLTSNMDKQSVFEIYRIIDRLYRLIENRPIFFTDDEINELTQRVHEYNNEIFKLAEDMYFARGFYFPCKNPSISGFFDENWAQKITNFDYLLDKDVIDAGAYVGDTALILSKYTNGNIHAFDPDNININIIQKTASLNPESRIIPVYAALTDYDGEVDFILGTGRDLNNDNFSGVVIGTIENKCAIYNSSATVTVPAMTIDKYVKDNNLKVGFIKTDVEGAEQNLLRGAIETIKSQKPILMISIYHSISDFFDIKTWIENLNLGYKFTIHRTVVEHSFLNETMLLCEVK